MKKFAAAALLLLAAVLFTSCGMFRDANDTTYVESTAADTVETAPEAESEASADTAAETSADTTAAPETEEAANSPTIISFLAVGDNVIHPNLYTDALNRSTDGVTYNFKPMYEDVADIIAAADIAFINQETIFGGAALGYSGYPCFNTPSDLGYDLADIGFDIVNIATNHMCDMGSTGYANALDFYDTLADETGVIMIGGFRDEEDYDNVRVIERGGVKIALLAYTYGTNGISLPSSSELVVPYIDEDTVVRQLEIARAAAAFVIVSVHWGTENTQVLTDEQTHMAQVMASNGADVIIGHHPHVLQKIDMLDNMYGGKTLCVYSLGNFTSSMMYPANMTGGIFTFDIVCDGYSRPYAANAVMTPTVFYYSTTWYGTHVYLMKDFTDELAASHGTARYGYPCTLAALKKAYTDVIAEEYRPKTYT